MTELDEVFIERPPDQRLPGNLNISFAYVEGESLLMGMKEIAVSSRLGLHLGHAWSRATC